MSSYFSLPSFARAKKNTEELQKKNPKNQVLKDEDEKFLNKQIEGEVADVAKDAPATQISESGEVKEISKEEAAKAGASDDQVVVPAEQPQTGDGAQEEAAADATKPVESSKEDSKESGSSVEKEDTATPKETAATAESSDKTTDIPAEDSLTKDPTDDLPKEASNEETADDPPEQVPEESNDKSETASFRAKKSKKNKGLDLPSQEEAEAATRGFPTVTGDEKSQSEPSEKKTWASYLPNIRSGAKKDGATEQKHTEDKPADDKKTDEKATNATTTDEKTTDDKSAEEQKDGQTDDQAQRRTWAEYASTAYSALPSIPSIPSLPESWKSKDGKAEPVYNEDGTIDEEKTKEKQHREASVLLDRLNLSSINNRVFAFSGETEKIYERFTQVLKDTMNGAPTAYEDMDKLMKDAGPELEKQFKSMPPFVQTLVKSLPAKFGTSMGPELLAMASEKPGADMKTRMEAASKKSQSSGGDQSINVASSSSTTKEEPKDGQKKKRKIPGLKGLVSEQGMVASILRNVVTFLKVRFPFLASMTNVVMSLAVFILMFVFWYCHKRGKEVRMAKELEAGKGEKGFVEGEDGEGEMEVEVSDEDDVEDEAEGEDEKKTGGNEKEVEGAEADGGAVEANVVEKKSKTEEDSAEAIGAAPKEAASTGEAGGDVVEAKVVESKSNTKEDSAEAIGAAPKEAASTGEARGDAVEAKVVKSKSNTQEDSAEAIGATPKEAASTTAKDEEVATKDGSKGGEGKSVEVKEPKPVAKEEDSAEAIGAVPKEAASTDMLFDAIYKHDINVVTAVKML
ncbi:hypothetical protein LTR17_003934 [Elasticomyces elasticus]|nr:hypothetical protein LTR17_003934 [Elasticomyces elasticus]